MMSMLDGRMDKASALQPEDCGFNSSLWSLCYSLQGVCQHLTMLTMIALATAMAAWRAAWDNIS